MALQVRAITKGETLIKTIAVAALAATSAFSCRRCRGATRCGRLRLRSPQLISPLRRVIAISPSTDSRGLCATLSPGAARNLWPRICRPVICRPVICRPGCCCRESVVMISTLEKSGCCTPGRKGAGSQEQ
jgi:hypothetical protein